MLITLYCNPFFAPCKEKIYENPDFFERFFQNFPEKGEDGRQKRAEAELPKGDSRQKREGIAHPEVAAAQAETQIDPCPEEDGNKRQISQPAGTEGAQKAIQKAQASAACQSLA